jgi:hypothetical protein
MTRQQLRLGFDDVGELTFDGFGAHKLRRTDRLFWDTDLADKRRTWDAINARQQAAGLLIRNRCPSNDDVCLRHTGPQLSQTCPVGANFNGYFGKSGSCVAIARH